MSLRTPDLNVEIAFANLNLDAFPIPGRPHWGSGLDELYEYAERTGFSNYEIHPTNRIVQEVEECSKDGNMPRAERVIGSLHESFNEGTGFFGQVADRVGLRRRLASIGGMFVIQTALTKPVVSVHIPSKNETLRLPPNKIRVRKGYPGSFPVAQPSAAIYRDFRVTNSDELEIQMNREGLVGYCPDTEHARCRDSDGTAPPNIEDVWAEQFASGRVFQMHLGGDRVDLAVRDPELAKRSVAEYKAFSSRHWQNALKTQKGDMLVAAIENWVPPEELAPKEPAATIGPPVLRIVAEIPPRPSRILNRPQRHARLIENLAHIVSHAGGTPLLFGTRAA